IEAAMLTIRMQPEGGATQTVDAVDPAWLTRDAGVTLWADMAEPSAGEGALLRDVFHFHDLAVEDALEETHYPKVDDYGGYLHVILHGIDAGATAGGRFSTHDIDFFLGPTYLVTVHAGRSRSVDHLQGLSLRNGHVLAGGPVGLMHRIVDALVDNYTQEVEALEEWLERLEDAVLETGDQRIVRDILALKRDVGRLRCVITPQRDVVARLARREYPAVSEAMAYRFRDVYDHLVRIAEE